MICDYQYVMKAPVETSNDAAEKFCMTTLYESNDEEISAYGIEEDSEYLSKVNIPKKKNEVVASQGYLEKYSLKVGDRVTLRISTARINIHSKLLAVTTILRHFVCL